MKQLMTLFKYIRKLNNFAIPEYINEDTNYYYFRISNSCCWYVTEIYKDRLLKLNGTDYIWEAKEILKRY